MLSEAVVYEFCASGALDRSIVHVREALAERCQRLADGIVEALPESSVVAPDGGYFLWVELPEARLDEAHRRSRRARRRGGHGDDFVVDGRSGALRLSYAPVTPAEIDAALERLAAAAASLG